VSTPRVPTGTVTFLFTDIEGSTRLWQQHPEAMRGALARHHELLHQAIESHVAHHRRDHARARSFYENSITRFRELNDGFCLAKSLISFALTSHEAGDHEHEGALGEQGLALLRASDGKGELALRLDQLGRAALGHGDVGRATRSFHESLTLWVEAQDAPGIATSLEALARVASARGRAPAVVRLLAAVRTWRRAQGLPDPEADREACDRALASAHSQLDPTAVEAAWSEGAAMTLEQAIAYAREPLTDLESSP
jgi:class 3 adenylate cyclase